MIFGEVVGYHEKEILTKCRIFGSTQVRNTGHWTLTKMRWPIGINRSYLSSYGT